LINLGIYAEQKYLSSLTQKFSFYNNFGSSSILLEKIREVGNETSSRMGKSNLSGVDEAFCLHSLQQLRKGTTYVATRDKLIIDTIYYMYGSFSNYLVSQGYPAHDLNFVFNLRELDSGLSKSVSLFSLSRKLSRVYKLGYRSSYMKRIWISN